MVGYELVPVTSSSYEDSNTLWYEKFYPSAWIPPTWECEGSIIKLMEGKPCKAKELIKAFHSSRRVYSGYLSSFIDETSGGRIDRLNYTNSPFRHCFIELLEVTQPLWNPSQDQVNMNHLTMLTIRAI